MLTAQEFQEMNKGTAPVEAGKFQSPPYAAQTPNQTPNQGGDLPQQLSELTSKYEHLNVRYKHIVEERDALSKQVMDLRRKLSEQEESSGGRGRAEEIRVLGKLIDEEHSLREAARESGTLLLDDLYKSHNRFVNAFFSIVGSDK
jgi:predicted transcriptional regulator